MLDEEAVRERWPDARVVHLVRGRKLRYRVMIPSNMEACSDVMDTDLEAWADTRRRLSEPNYSELVQAGKNVMDVNKRLYRQIEEMRKDAEVRDQGLINKDNLISVLQRKAWELEAERDAWKKVGELAMLPEEELDKQEYVLAYEAARELEQRHREARR